MIQKITLFSNPERPLQPSVHRAFLAACKKLKVHVRLAESAHGARARSRNDLRDTAGDLIFACGGDGTVLQAAHRSRGSGVPLIGVNTGHLGYLAPLRPEQLIDALPHILRGGFRVEQRHAIEVDVYDYQNRGAICKRGWALNDIVIDRSTNRLVELQATINHTPVTDYRADGVVICTATGSTAYNLSLGGPLVARTSDVITITPKAALTLTNRSLVEAGSSLIELRPALACGPVHIETDGIRIGTFSGNYNVCIHRSAVTVPIAFLPDHNNYTTLGERLGWNRNNLTR